MKRHIRPFLSLILCLWVQPLFAQNLISNDEDWTAINLQVTDELVIPAYQILQLVSEDLLETSDGFCAEPTAESLIAMKQDFYRTLDAWEAVQYIQFGPITYFNWNFRLQYWPDDRGTGGRQLSALIAAENAEVLATDSFARQSVGVQGLPALERLLFADEALAAYQSNPYLCQLSVAISRNINEISTGVEQRWTEEYRSVVLDPASGGVYENAEDLSIEFLKALQESIARIRDLKLVPVLGESFAASRARQAESWRSMYSLANIKNNLQSLEPLFTAYAAAFYAEDVQVIEAAFAELNASLSGMPDSMQGLLETEQEYERLQALHAQVESLHEALETALKNTDLYLGFNSLDGD